MLPDCVPLQALTLKRHRRAVSDGVETPTLSVQNNTQRKFCLSSFTLLRTVQKGRLFFGLRCMKRVNAGCFSAPLPTLRASVSCGAGRRCPEACGFRHRDALSLVTDGKTKGRL